MQAAFAGNLALQQGAMQACFSDNPPKSKEDYIDRFMGENAYINMFGYDPIEGGIGIEDTEAFALFGDMLVLAEEREEMRAENFPFMVLGGVFMLVILTLILLNI